MNKQARKEQAIKYLQQLDIYKPYIDGFEKHDHVCVFERFAGFWVYQYPEIEAMSDKVNKIIDNARKVRTARKTAA